MTALRVALDPADGVRGAVLASVPGRFVVAGNGTADVAVVSGRSPGWPTDVARAVDGGVRGVLVVRPALVGAGAVRDLARAVAGRAVVAVDTAYAADPTWTAARDEVAGDAAAASIVDSVVSVPDGDPVGALLDQLAVVRAAAGPFDAPRLVHRGDRAYVLVARTPGPRVTLAGVTSAAGRAALALDVVAPARRWQVRFDDAALARPTEVTVHDETGAHTRPLVYESGRRVTWQRLHRALTGDGEVSYGLDQLAEDLSLAVHLMEGPT
jgi:hypothetical protein